MRIRRLILAVLVFAASSVMVQAFDFAQVQRKIEAACKEGNLDFSTISELSAYSVGRLTLKKAKVLVSPKQNDLLVMIGEGKLPGDFMGLKDKTADLVITLAPDVATSKQAKDMICTITAFSKNWTIGDCYPGNNNQLLVWLKSVRGFFSYSSAKQNLASDLLPDEAREKFAEIFGPDFILGQQNGVTFYSLFKFDAVEPLKKLASLVKGLDANLRLSAFLCLNPSDIKIQIELANVTWPFMPSNFAGSSPFLFISGQPALGFGSNFAFKLPPHDDLVQGILQLTLPFGAKPSAVTGPDAGDASKQAVKDGASLLGTLQGVWRDAFGIENVTLYDLVLKGQVPFSGPGLNLGLGGKIDFGKVKVEVAGKIPTTGNFGDFAAMGKADLIPFGELFAFLLKTVANDLTSSLPLDRLALKDVLVSVAAKDDRDLNIKAGIKFAGNLIFAGQSIGRIDIRTYHRDQSKIGIKLAGFVGQGWVKEIKIGPLLITGHGPDGKPNTSDDGVYLDLAMNTPMSDHLTFSGRVKLFKAEREVQCKTTYSSIELFLREKVFDLYESEMTLIGKADLKNPEFLAKVVLKDTFLDEAIKQITTILKDAADGLADDLEDAKEAMKDAEDDLAEAREEASKGIDEIKKKFEKAEEALEKAEKKLKAIDNKLDKTKKRFDKCKWNQAKKKAKLAARIAGLQSSYATQKTALSTLRKLLSEKNLDKAADAAKKAAEAALKLAEEAVNTAAKRMADTQRLAEKTAGFAQKIGDLEKQIKLTEAGFEMALEDLKKSKTPKLFVKAEAFGKPVECKLQFDFSKQTEAFVDLAKALFEEAAKVQKELAAPALILLEVL